MPLQLVAISGPDKGRVFALKGGPSLLLGRSSSCDLQFIDPHMSRLQCRLEVVGDRVFLTDADSKRGTEVNGRLVTVSEISIGDVILLGHTEVRLEKVSSGKSGYSSRTPVSEQASERPTDGPVESQRTIASSSSRSMPSVGGGISSDYSVSSVSPRKLRVEELLGTTLRRYEIREIVTRAHSGIVFKAYEAKRDRPIALKVFWPNMADEEEDRQKLIQSLRTMLPIRHPHLVAMHGAGIMDSFCWTALEFVEGESVRQVIQRMDSGAQVPWQFALRVALHISSALELAAEHRIIHRNITPQNILISRAEQSAKLNDLMLTTALECLALERVAQPSQLASDLAYKSPEQTSPGEIVDSRSDIYSLGAVTYALVTGKPPFQGTFPVDTVMKIQTEEPVRPKKLNPAVDPGFETIILTMLEKHPQGRFASPTELVTALSKVARTSGLLGG